MMGYIIKVFKSHHVDGIFLFLFLVERGKNEKFMKLVRKNFIKKNYVLTKKEALRYLRSLEALNEIKNAYDSSLKEYRNGIITYKVFKIGCVSSVSYCLTYMYE